MTHYVEEMSNESEQATILIVDDNPTNLRVLVDALKTSGFKTLVAASGEWAIQQVDRIRPDLILLDVLMPGIDGFETCRQLKAKEVSREIPIIFMTALSDTVEKLKGFEVGGVDYLTKPLQHEEVVARVSTHLTIRQLQQQLKEQNEQLRWEISERERAEKMLRQQNQQLEVLDQVSDLLQSCYTEPESYDVIVSVCKQLFPEDSGYLCLTNAEQTTLKMVTFWGNLPHKSLTFDVNDCWAVQHDKVLMATDPSATELACPHCCSESAYNYVCAPITLPGEILGILHLACQAKESDPVDAERKCFLEMKKMVILRMVKHYALSLTNLRLRETLHLEAIHDPLTGLYNRRYMEESLAQEADRAKRRNAPVGIIMLDIDHFKRLNDTYGHEAGDIVLRDLGTFLQSHVRRGDIACRYGGEEFLLILPDSCLESTTKRAEELCRSVRELSITYQDNMLQITASLGVAMLPHYSPDIRQAVNAADKALYQAKTNGRNQVIVASAMQSEASASDT